jgi:hypothetical protein
MRGDMKYEKEKYYNNVKYNPTFFKYGIMPCGKRK